MRFDASRATAHLAALAEQHGIHIEWIRGYSQAASYPPLKVVCLPRPTDGLRYMIGLHEFGHCRSQGARRWELREDIYGVTVCEGYAWAWAAQNRDPLVRVTRREWARAGDMFASYLAEPHEPSAAVG